MNLRILKKLSKRAVPFIEKERYQKDCLFKAEREDNYTHTGRHDRKHWKRSRYKHEISFSKHDISTKAKDGNGFINLSQHYIHPWKGTDMVGWTSGYEEPEWEEETAWDYLKNLVFIETVDYVDIPGTEDECGCPEHKLVYTRKLNNPRDYFKAMKDLKKN